MTFRAATPASGYLCTNEKASLAFEAHGTASSSNPHHVAITSGTFQVNNNNSEILYSGNIGNHPGSFINNTREGSLSLNYQVNRAPSAPSCISSGSQLTIQTSCSGLDRNDISTFSTSTGISFGNFAGAVECSKGGGNSASSSSSMTGTAQDSDGDGIPDSSDRCASNSNQRCYKDSK
jgi:hypothetical protein